MRRLIATLNLLVLANLVNVQGGSSCPQAVSGHHGKAVAVSAAAGHAGHDMSARADHGTAQSMPDEGPSHAPACMMLGPCAVTLDVPNAVGAATGASTADRLLAVSDHLPRSAGIAPELPPPRT